MATAGPGPFIAFDSTVASLQAVLPGKTVSGSQKGAQNHPGHPKTVVSGGSVFHHDAMCHQSDHLEPHTAQEVFTAQR